MVHSESRVRAILGRLHDDSVRVAEFHLRESVEFSAATPEMLPVIATLVAVLAAEQIGLRAAQEAYAQGWIDASEEASRHSWTFGLDLRAIARVAVGAGVIVSVAVAVGWMAAR